MSSTKNELDYRCFLNRLRKIRQENRWFNQVEDELCQTLRERSKLIHIYELDGEQNLEDAILQTLFNGEF